MSRDRDPAGKPRNARPRDALGRPLDRSESDAGQARVPDDLTITGPDAARLADQLLQQGRPFHAHEVLEAAWKNGPNDERMLWQGLAQLAVGITHAQRGNVSGAMSLLRSASARLSHGDNPARYAIDIAGLIDFVDALIGDLTAGVEIAPERLRPRLVVVEPGSG